jgi:hypothetical protein
LFLHLSEVTVLGMAVQTDINGSTCPTAAAECEGLSRVTDGADSCLCCLRSRFLPSMRLSPTQHASFSYPACVSLLCLLDDSPGSDQSPRGLEATDSKPGGGGDTFSLEIVFAHNIVLGNIREGRLVSLVLPIQIIFEDAIVFQSGDVTKATQKPLDQDGKRVGHICSCQEDDIGDSVLPGDAP